MYNNGEMYWYNKLTKCWYNCQHNITKTSNKDTMMHPWGPMKNPHELKIWKLENLPHIIKYNMDDSTSTLMEYMEMSPKEVEITPVISVNGVPFNDVLMREIRMLKQVPSDSKTLQEFKLSVGTQEAPQIRKAKMICQMENELNVCFFFFLFFVFCNFGSKKTQVFVLYFHTISLH